MNDEVKAFALTSSFIVPTSSFLFIPSQNPRGVAGDRGPGGHVARDDRAGPDRGALADLDAAEDGRARPDGGPAPDDGAFERPVRLPLRRAVGVGRARAAVVDELDAVADEDLVLDRHALADEGVAGDFAARADARALLDFDERADPRLVADLAAVEVDEVVDRHVAAEPHVVRDDAELSAHKKVEG